MKVVDRFGRRWKVRRRWLPWRRRVRDVPDMPFDDVGDLGDDPISAIIGIFLLVLAIPAIVVVLLLLAELLLLLLLLPLFVLIRLLLPVPWTIELWSRPERRRVLGWHLEHEVPVAGWRASQERIATMSAEIRTGDHGGRYVPDGSRTAWEEHDDAADGAPGAGDGSDAGHPPVDARPTAPGRVDRSGATLPGTTPNPFAQRDEG